MRLLSWFYCIVQVWPRPPLSSAARPRTVSNNSTSRVTTSSHFPTPPWAAGIIGREIAMWSRSAARRSEKEDQQGDRPMGSKGGNATAATNKQNNRSAAVDPAKEWSELMALKKALPLIIGFICLFEMYHQQFADVDFTRTVEYPEELQRTHDRNLLRAACSWIGQYAVSPEDWRKRCCLFTFLVGERFLGAYLGLKWTLWYGRWYNMIQSPKESFPLFWPLLANFFVLVFVDTAKGVYTGYINDWFMLDWKTWMTQRFRIRWLSERAFYEFELHQKCPDPVDNPDQRIAEDATSFCDLTYDLSMGLLSVCLNLNIYVPMLWNISPTSVFGLFNCKGWLVYLAIVWAAGGTYLINLFGRVLTALKYATQRYDADFRFALVRVRMNSESIAMLNAEPAETRTLIRRWDGIRRVTWEWMKFNKQFGIVMSLYDYCESFITMVVLVPAYLTGELTLGSMRMGESALGHVKSEFEYVIRYYGTITSYRAAISRLQAFEKDQPIHQNEESSPNDNGDQEGAVNNESTMPSPAKAVRGGRDLSVKGLQVSLPSGSVLVEVPSEFRVVAGDRILLSGPVGSGKSTLLRAFADIWPHASLAEDGHFQLPVQEHCLFVPRDPTLPLGSLREAATYPEPPGTYSDDDILEVIQAVGLGASFRTDGPSVEAIDFKVLDWQDDWNSTLSGGELQRLIIAHILLRRPSLVFLDEATSNMGRQQATHLYNLILERLGPESAVITISHDIEGMLPLHNKHIRVNAETKTLEANSPTDVT